MTSGRFTACLLLLSLVSFVSAKTLEKTWTLYHSLNGGQDFSKRSTIVLSVDPETDGTVDLSITNDNSTLNEETFQAVRAAGSLYQLKLVDGSSRGNDISNNFVLSSVPGCQLVRANFREELVISLGPKASAISLTYIPLVSPLAPKSCDDPLWDNKASNLQGWESRISWETATPGMVLRTVMPQYRPPPGLKWLPRMATNGKLYQAQGPPGAGDSKDGKGGDAPPEMDNTPMGFVKRYWYILLPLFLMNVIGTEPAPPEGQQQGGGQQPQGGAAPAAAPAGGAAPKQRRGKRG